MSATILHCKFCKKYTMQPVCTCGNATTTVRPAKFSLDDKWGKYRREYKKEHAKDL